MKLCCSVSIWLTIALIAICPTFVAADGPRPNILLLIVDDMNDWAGCLGGHPDAKTPHIDQLASRGVLFTNAHCVSPICGPSRASVLTGMRPETTGVYHNVGNYRTYVPDAVTFPERFRQHGYRTMAAGKVNHDLGVPDPRLWDENGPNCGVLGTPFVDDELDLSTMQPTRRIDRGMLRITLPANGGLSAIDRPTNKWDSFDWAPLDVPDADYPDHQIASWGCAKLAERTEQSFLTATGFYKPHQPFFAPRRFFELCKNAQLPATLAGDLKDVPPAGRELATLPWTSAAHQTVIKHNAWGDAVRAYLATISFVDEQLGRVVAALDAGPHAQSTWIVLWSDHGWSLGEKQHWGKHAPWSETVRVPLLIVPPNNQQPRGFRAGTRCAAMVSLLDLYPTLIEMAGLPAQSELEGRSLVPLIANPETEWVDAVVCTVGRGTHSVATKNWRYIRYFDGSEELYDLKADPKEWYNLASDPSHNVVRERLAAHIPNDKRIARTIRCGRYKCVVPTVGKPMLFDLHAAMGISEQNDIAAEHPAIVEAIVQALVSQSPDTRRLSLPDRVLTKPE